MTATFRSRKVISVDLMNELTDNPRSSLLITVLITLLLAGCHGPRSGSMVSESEQTAIVPEHPWAPTGLPMFDGSNGKIMTWASLIDAIARADVVVLGEEHDDSVAHRFQLAVVSQVLASWPKTAVALEMLERDQQEQVDAYLAGKLTETAFLETVASGPESRRSFAEFYLPIVDAAGREDATVIAANAPRKFVRMARTEGWDGLLEQPRDQRDLYVLPETLDQGAYRQRIEELMRSYGKEPTREAVDEVLRAQQIWDSTMADSTLRALRHADKVVLLVGRFHGDFAGGTVEQINRHDVLARVLYVSTINEDARRLRPEDVGRADLVVYTGGVARGEDPIDPTDDEPLP